jgi:hypothetical protein
MRFSSPIAFSSGAEPLMPFGPRAPGLPYVMAAEMVARADAGFANIWGLQDCAETIYEFGSEEQRKKYYFYIQININYLVIIFFFIKKHLILFTHFILKKQNNKEIFQKRRLNTIRIMMKVLEMRSQAL